MNYTTSPKLKKAIERKARKVRAKRKPGVFIICEVHRCGTTIPTFNIDPVGGAKLNKPIRVEMYEALKAVAERHGLEVNPWVDAPHGEYEER